MQIVYNILFFMRYKNNALTPALTCTARAVMRAIPVKAATKRYAGQVCSKRLRAGWVTVQRVVSHKPLLIKYLTVIRHS